MKGYRTRYESELLERVVPFWTKHGIDREHGGYFSVVGRKGELLEAEKYLWMQWRAVFMFAALYNSPYSRPEWLEHARRGFDFLSQHSFRPDGHSYFSLKRDGSPGLREFGGYTVFTDSFAAIGAAELYRADPQPRCREIALQATASYRAGFAAAEKSGSMALAHYMILTNVLFTLQRALRTKDYDGVLRQAAETVLNHFWSREHQMMFESMPPDGKPDLSSGNGRLLNPGHALEGMWFVMQYAESVNDRAMIARCLELTRAILQYAWDPVHGGILYFKDARDLPLLDGKQYLKTWWGQNEALIACLYAWKLSGDGFFADCFRKIDAWAWKHFRDPEFPEWYPHVLPDGTPFMFCKGTMFKGFFHMPRCLMMCAQMLPK
ncbi:MAG: AGE family epimerase/isomerase [Verrucomicrobia bacterium]|nr:AGE family epimerase/isomerase [Verrucomicrobiota bacterium]